jgi:hypothetical protein
MKGIGIILNKSDNKIKILHLIDVNEKLIYNGSKKIKDYFFNDPNLRIEKYDFSSAISEEIFNKCLELNYKKISKFTIKNFIHKYQLEEILI